MPGWKSETELICCPFAVILKLTDMLLPAAAAAAAAAAAVVVVAAAAAACVVFHDIY